MTDPHDEVDDWLRTEVTPLGPPPGTLDRVRRRARQRKMRQVVVASAGCAVVLAAAVAVPTLVSGQQGAGGTLPVAASNPPAATQPRPRSPAAAGPEASGSRPLHTQLSTTTSGTSPPPHFRPTSVTFVGTGSGVVGAVIGQAGPPCATRDCTSLAGTSDYGTSWYGVSAPLAPGPDGDAGVSQLRFVNLVDGWAYGPALYETTGGGWPWVQESTDGQRVTALEASGHSALAIFATCSGTGADYAADCTSFALYGSAAGTKTWAPVSVPARFQHMSDGQPSSAALVIAGSTGYVLAPDGTVLTGPVSGGAWTVAGQAPCDPGSALGTGAPAGAQLAASQGQLLLTCQQQPSGTITLYTSAGGAGWRMVGPVPGNGAPAALASAASGHVVLATTAGIDYTADGGTTWRSAQIAGQVPAGGFGYVGMTNKLQGVAVPADASLGAVYVTADGGQTWSKSPIAG